MIENNINLIFKGFVELGWGYDHEHETLII